MSEGGTRKRVADSGGSYIRTKRPESERTNPVEIVLVRMKRVGAEMVGRKVAEAKCCCPNFW